MASHPRVVVFDADKFCPRPLAGLFRADEHGPGRRDGDRALVDHRRGFFAGDEGAFGLADPVAHRLRAQDTHRDSLRGALPVAGTSTGYDETDPGEGVDRPLALVQHETAISVGKGAVRYRPGPGDRPVVEVERMLVCLCGDLRAAGRGVCLALGASGFPLPEHEYPR